MTHEYVIALGGRIAGSSPDDPVGASATAIAWAADRVLAVGPDDLVSAMSRGDSTFIDLRGSVVTAAAGEGTGDLDVGSPADLDFWDADATDAPREPRIIARVRAGSFTEGDVHYGPFAPVPTPLPDRGSLDPGLPEDRP